MASTKIKFVNNVNQNAQLMDVAGQNTAKINTIQILNKLSSGIMAVLPDF